MIELRDRHCRTPWCDAPIRHTDHVIPFAGGGPTSYANGQGLCEACNHAKQAGGWRHAPGPDGLGVVTITTPTGRRHTSKPALHKRGCSSEVNIELTKNLAEINQLKIRRANTH